MTTKQKYEAHIKPASTNWTFANANGDEIKLNLSHFVVDNGILKATDGNKFFEMVTGSHGHECEMFEIAPWSFFLYKEGSHISPELSILGKLQFYKLDLSILHYCFGSFNERDMYIYLLYQLYRNESSAIAKTLQGIDDYKFEGPASRADVWKSILRG